MLKIAVDVAHADLFEDGSGACRSLTEAGDESSTGGQRRQLLAQQRQIGFAERGRHLEKQKI